MQFLSELSQESLAMVLDYKLKKRTVNTIWDSESLSRLPVLKCGRGAKKLSKGSKKKEKKILITRAQ